MDDLTGQKYGKWTVLYRGENSGKSPRWVCKCECGKEKLVFGRYLKSGASKSCGCTHNALMNKDSYIGTKKNMLTIYDVVKKDNNGALCTYYICKCECGNIIYVSQVSWGKQISCGALEKDGVLIILVKDLAS